MSLKKHLNQSSGFSLMETLIAAAVIALIVIAVVNQRKLVSATRIRSNSSSIVNSLKDKVITALANEKTCTLNFKNVSMVSTIHTKIIDSESGTIIQVGDSYGGANTFSDNSNDLVKVTSITTEQNGVLDELKLTIKFTKKNNFIKIISSDEEFVLPLTMIKDSVGNLGYCFSDATLSIATAIRLSCKGNTAFYDETDNPPYGSCKFMVQPTMPICNPSQFIHKIGINLSGLPDTVKTNNVNQLEFECKSLESTCPTNSVVTKTNADGTVTCGPPVESCANGQVMVMVGGRFTCLRSDVGCTGLYAIKGINSDGTFDCQRFYPPNTCTGFVTSIAPGSITCSENMTPGSCPPGEYITSVDGGGNPSCSPWVTLPYNCPSGQGATGIDASGNLTCQPMDKKLSCAGATGTKKFTECLAAGGTINDRYVPGSTNAYCIFTFPQTTTPACPVGWTACSNLRTTINNTCDDTNSACNQSAVDASKYKHLTALGYSFSAHNPSIVTCDKWMRDSGPWVYTCTPVPQTPTSAYTTQLGCY